MVVSVYQESAVPSILLTIRAFYDPCGTVQYLIQYRCSVESEDFAVLYIGYVLLGCFCKWLPNGFA